MGEKLKINVDVAFYNKRKIGEVTAVMKDSNGTFIIGRSQKIYYDSALVAEALAIREGLFLTSSCYCDQVIIESDCLQLIEACQNNSWLWQVDFIIEDIFTIQRSFAECGLVWAAREGNELAHHVAKLSLQGKLLVDWIVSKPFIFSQIIERDFLPS